MKANHITFKYYDHSKNIILSDITFEIPKNRISLLMGGSGSGKSTLAYLVAGLLPDNGGILTHGNVSVCDQDIRNFKPHQRAKHVSMMFQNADLQFCMSTLQEELIFCLENINLNNHSIDTRIADSVSLVGTSHLLHQKFSTLSGGEKQKCALTCMIALQSEYLILDEPFANIDPSTAGNLIQLIQDIQRKRNLSILIIDHMIERWLPIIHHTFILTDNHTIAEAKITVDNLEDFEDFFLENGLLFPKSFIYKKTVLSSVPPIVSAQNLTLSVPSKTLLVDANFTIYPGTINVVLGPSGCGKTTLLKSFFGRIKYQGSLSIYGIEAKKKHFKKLCNICGIVLQNPSNQFVTQNVLEEILFSLNTHIISSEEDKKAYAIELLTSFELDVYQRYSPYMLSQGQQRRLAVLSVLCANQKLLLLDEPTYGQDGASTNSIMNLLKKKVHEEGLTVLMTTHDLDLAKQYADCIFMMDEQTIKPYKEVLL